MTSPAAAWRPTEGEVAAEFALLEEDVRHFSAGTDPDLGAVRYRHADWPPPWWVWPVVVVLCGFAFIGDQPLWSNLVFAAIILLCALAVLAMAGSKTLTVHERAIVLGNRFSRRFGWVVPLCTLDHSRIRVHRNYPSMGRRIGSIRTGYRTAFYTRTALSMEGLTARVASRRGSGFEMERTLPRPWERYLEVPRAQDAPVEEWQAWPTQLWITSTRRERELLTAIEDALVTSGRTSARGLTERVLASVVTERHRDPVTDEEIYGTGPDAFEWFRPAAEPQPQAWGMKRQ